MKTLFKFVVGAVVVYLVGLFVITQFPILDRLARTKVIGGMGGQA